MMLSLDPSGFDTFTNSNPESADSINAFQSSMSRSLALWIVHIDKSKDLNEIISQEWESFFHKDLPKQLFLILGNSIRLRQDLLYDQNLCTCFEARA